MEWHQALMCSDNLAIPGSADIGTIAYLLAYATGDDTRSLSRHDQFLIYINKDNRQADYIKFTFQKLMKSYAGMVHHKEYASIGGIQMPFRIGISDNLHDPDFDHYFVIESIAFKQ